MSVWVGGMDGEREDAYQGDPPCPAAGIPAPTPSTPPPHPRPTHPPLARPLQRLLPQLWSASTSSGEGGGCIRGGACVCGGAMSWGDSGGIGCARAHAHPKHTPCLTRPPPSPPPHPPQVSGCGPPHHGGRPGRPPRRHLRAVGRRRVPRAAVPPRRVGAPLRAARRAAHLGVSSPAPPCQLACLVACVPPCLPCLLGCLRASLPACLPCRLGCLPAGFCLPACLSTPRTLIAPPNPPPLPATLCSPAVPTCATAPWRRGRWGGRQRPPSWMAPYWGTAPPQCASTSLATPASW